MASIKPIHLFERVLCCGDNDWQNYAMVRSALATLPRETIVVHCQEGPSDECAENAAHDLGLPASHSYPSLRNVESRRSRNAEVFDQEHPRLVLAFWNQGGIRGNSKNVVEEARRRGIETKIFSELPIQPRKVPHGELSEHREGKENIARRFREVQHKLQCEKCEHVFFQPDYSVVATERPITLSEDKYVLDVALLNDLYMVMCAIEIRATHAVPQSKCRALETARVPYTEIHASGIAVGLHYDPQNRFPTHTHSFARCACGCRTLLWSPIK